MRDTGELAPARGRLDCVIMGEESGEGICWKEDAEDVTEGEYKLRGIVLVSFEIDPLDLVFKFPMDMDIFNALSLLPKPLVPELALLRA